MKFITAIAALALTASTYQSVQASSSVDSSVSGRHFADVTRDVQQWHELQQPDCAFKRVHAVQILTRDPDTSEESWTVEACDKEQFTYRVYVIFNDAGGITSSVSNLDTTAHNEAGESELSKEECGAVLNKLEAAEKANDYSSQGIADYVQLVADMAACNASADAP